MIGSFTYHHNIITNKKEGVVARAVKKAPAALPKGKRSKKFDGCIEIPVDAVREDKRFPRMSKRVLDDTYWLFDTKARKIRWLFSVMPDGLNVAWGNCGRCHDHFRYCKCPDGVYHCSGVAHIRSTTVELSGGDPHVPGRFFDPYNRDGRPVQRPVWAPVTALRPTTVPDASPEAPARTGRRRASVLEATKPTRSRTTEKADTRDIDTLDFGKLAEQAMAVAEQEIARMGKMTRRKKG